LDCLAVKKKFVHEKLKIVVCEFRRYQDFYLLQQKLTEFHGVFSDARLPPRRSATTARNLEFLESIKKDFEHFLRVRTAYQTSKYSFDIF
jgi:sorting nexin-14